MKTQYKILLITIIAVAVTIPAISTASHKPIDDVRCMESSPYPNVMEASEAVQYFMDEYGYTTFVIGEVNFPGGINSPEQHHLPATITLCVRESSTFEP